MGLRDVDSQTACRTLLVILQSHGSSRQPVYFMSQYNRQRQRLFKKRRDLPVIG